MRLPFQHLTTLIDALANFEALQTFLTPLGWASPTLINGWSGGTMQYTRISGVMMFRGQSSTNGTTGTAAFILPPGCRPSRGDFYPLLLSSGVQGGFAFVDVDGSVYLNYAAGTDVLLSPISFVAEQ